jgi:hypothetical protein
MFHLLCLALCLAVMFLVLVATSVLSVPLVRLLERRLKGGNPRTAANALLIFRLLPFSLAIAVSLGLALPAFMEFEPPSTQEMVSWPLIVLAVSGCGVLALTFVRWLRILRMTRLMQHEWQKHSRPVPGMASHVPLYRVETRASLLAVIGIFRPKIFVSRTVAEELTQAELAAALSHEIAHVRSYDNLKQLLMKITAPPAWIPGLQGSDEAWTRASEMAADESALAEGASALELSSALIKVGRLSLGRTVPGALAASHLVPCGCNSATLTRAAHLRDLLEKGTAALPAKNSGRGMIVTALLLAGVIYISCLVTLLPAVHETLEFLVR